MLQTHTHTELLYEVLFEARTLCITKEKLENRCIGFLDLWLYGIFSHRFTGFLFSCLAPRFYFLYISHGLVAVPKFYPRVRGEDVQMELVGFCWICLWVESMERKIEGLLRNLRGWYRSVSVRWARRYFKYICNVCLMAVALLTTVCVNTKNFIVLVLPEDIFPIKAFILGS